MTSYLPRPSVSPKGTKKPTQNTHSSSFNTPNTPSAYFADLQRLGTVSEVILPHRCGRVHYQDSWWPAICLENQRLEPDTLVRVIDRQNITLVVEPYQQ
jgi:membrane protein implicated in regulation of membrane protease activity